MSENVQAVPQVLPAFSVRLWSFAAIDARFDQFETRVDRRFEQVDDVLRKQRRDTAGLLVVAKSLSGNLAEELAAIEERVTALETRKGR